MHVKLTINKKKRKNKTEEEEEKKKKKNKKRLKISWANFNGLNSTYQKICTKNLYQICWVIKMSFMHEFVLTQVKFQK